MWIKIRTNLRDDPAVLRLAQALGADLDLVVGRLVHLWSWASDVTRDGSVTGVTSMGVDTLLSHPGFASECVKVGWLEQTSAGVRFPKWDRYMAETSRVRQLAAERQRRCRRKASRVTGVTLVTDVTRDKRDGCHARDRDRDIHPPLPPQGGSEGGKPAGDGGGRNGLRQELQTRYGFCPAEATEVLERGLTAEDLAAWRRVLESCGQDIQVPVAWTRALMIQWRHPREAGLHRDRWAPPATVPASALPPDWEPAKEMDVAELLKARRREAGKEAT